MRGKNAPRNLTASEPGQARNIPAGIDVQARSNKPWKPWRDEKDLNRDEAVIRMVAVKLVEDKLGGLSMAEFIVLEGYIKQKLSHEVKIVVRNKTGDMTMLERTVTEVLGKVLKQVEIAYPETLDYHAETFRSERLVSKRSKQTGSSSAVSDRQSDISGGSNSR